MRRRAPILLLGLLLGAAPCFANVPAVVIDLAGVWRTETGEGRDWAEEDFDDRAWRQVRLPGNWTDLGYQGADGALWFRYRLDVDGEQLRRLTPSGAAILIDACRYGNYDLFVNGRFIDSARHPPDGGVPLGRPQVFELPDDVLPRALPGGTAPGQLVIALRVERVRWASDSAPDGGPVGAVILLGDRDNLEERAENLRRHVFLDHRLAAAATLIFFLTGLYHLELFRHHRQSREYLWFGLMSLSFAVATALTAPAAWDVDVSYSLIEKLSAAAKHLSLAFQIQFLWILVEKTVSSALRAYQISHVFIALTVLVVPTDWVVATDGVRLLWAVLIFPAITLILIREIRQPHVEARLIGFAGLALIAASLVYIGGHLVGFNVPGPLPAWAFLLFVVAMVVTLVMRFSRLHDALDALNRRLEERVENRTHELTEKEKSLVRKEREILLAHDHLARSERMVALGHLVAGVAHAIESPARFISSGLPSVRRDAEEIATLVPEKNRGPDFKKLHTRLRDLLGVLEDGAGRISEIVSNLRSYSRQDDATLAPCNLHQQIEASLQILEEMMNDRIEVIRRYDDDIPPVECFPALLRQALVNLLTNAVQSIRDEGTITLTTKMLDENQVRISIRDDGRGMPAHVQRRIFEPFFSTRPTSEATGLGLSITSGIVDRHRGSMEIASVVDHGTEVVLTMPIAHRLHTPAPILNEDVGD